MVFVVFIKFLVGFLHTQKQRTPIPGL